MPQKIPVRPSSTADNPARLFERHFISRIPSIPVKQPVLDKNLIAQKKGVKAREKSNGKKKERNRTRKTVTDD
ncbi:hypothetical protein TNCV_4606921 [Trichonephila clavipes]|nr:hypothetical protein TNCV_4606921 [Trichonephila clavipes]